MPYLFTPPTREVATPSRDPFWRRTKDTVAESVLKLGNKQYRTVSDPSNESVASSELAYLGGRTYYISDPEAADLTAAGYGAYISGVSAGSGYGHGRYGEGNYGFGDTESSNIVGESPNGRPYGSGPYGTGTYDGRG